jgi:Flp pilus assembly protein TadB
MFLYLVNREYISRLFTSGFCGWALVVCSAISITAGYFTIRKIVNIEV